MIELRLILTNTEGIPSIYYSDTVYQHRALVMELLGPSLATLFNKCRRRFSVKTTAMIAIQLVSICTVYIRQAAF